MILIHTFGFKLKIEFLSQYEPFSKVIYYYFIFELFQY